MNQCYMGRLPRYYNYVERYYMLNDLLNMMDKEWQIHQLILLFEEANHQDQMICHFVNSSVSKNHTRIKINLIHSWEKFAESTVDVKVLSLTVKTLEKYNYWIE